MRRSLLLLLVSLWAAAAQAQRPAIELNVDARDVARKLLHAQMRIPAAPGPLTLVYPKWLPGEHGPTGPVTDLVNLRVSAGGKPVAWHRDPVDMYALHVDVPAGADAVEVALDFLSPGSQSGFSSAASATPHLALLTWNQLLLYPQGPKSDEVMFKPSLRLPAGWKYGTSLTTVRETPDRIELAPLSLTMLVDSPVLTGEYFRVVPLDTSDRDVALDIAADSQAALAITPETTEALRRVVAQADALFGARHYDHYRFLLTLSDHVAHFGLEHHQSNDSRMAERALVDSTLGRLALGVLSHEYVHSWNGKYRRPAGLATPDFQEPMQGELLWVYEGLTQYLGNLLAVRSGLWTPQRYRERLAKVASDLEHRPGREWRPLTDTAVAAQLLYEAPRAWASFRRGTDFYDEGWLIWLDADMLIREQTKGKRSLDDFCRRFHGGASGSPTVKTYTLDDVVRTLNEVHPYDWRKFLMDRVTATGAHAPLGGIERSGYRLVYNDTRNEYLKDIEEGGDDGLADAGASIGLRVKEDGEIQDAIPGTPAYEAGITPGMKLIAVNGRKFNSDVLRDTLLATSGAPATLTLLIETNDDFFSQHTIQYGKGLQEPHLERDGSKPDLLERHMAPLSAGSEKTAGTP
ncbi:MAG TPA: M61 family peptidase [Thermoanaerobaculia bacterium]|jgi:predicted metalloprotease with PDZ domain|nr:M61 family peptidase [Thermoanaerobaculia bacterium]